MFFWRKSPAQAFWAWFRKNESRLFDVEREQAQVFAELAAALKPLGPDLTFEFGPKQDGRREFAISAGGMKAAFPAVEALVAAAPALPRWNILAFRPRRAAPMPLTFGDTTVDPADVDCCLTVEDGQIGLYLFFRGYTDALSDAWGQVGFLLLDQALGERDVSLKVGPIGFLSFDVHPEADRFPLPQLAARFDERVASLPSFTAA